MVNLILDNIEHKRERKLEHVNYKKWRKVDHDNVYDGSSVLQKLNLKKK